jgi:hypothetical protein
MGHPMKRNLELPLKTKIKIAKELDSNITVREYARKYGTSKSVVGRISKDLDKYIALDENEISSDAVRFPYKSNFDCLFDLIEKDVRMLRKKQVSLSTAILKEIAIKHAKKQKLDNFKFSQSWFSKLKGVLNIKYKKLCGSSEHYDKNAATEYVKNFEYVVKGYDPKDIFNCDESCFYIRGQNSKSFVIDENSIPKKDSEKITCLLTCSMLGEKLPLFIIGRSRKPRCFKDFDFSKLKVRYAANKTAFITSNLFNEYLDSINNEFNNKGRKILLVMDNCTSHICQQFSNIKIEFIPKNTSALIQPLDKGIIKVIKDKYRYRLSSHIANSIDSENINLKEIKLIDSIVWLNEIWWKLSSETITNCWKNSGLYISSEEIMENKTEDDCLKEYEDIEISSEIQILDNLSLDTSMDFNSVLNDDEMIKLKILINEIKPLMRKASVDIYSDYILFENKVDDMIRGRLKGDIRFYMGSRGYN